MIASLIHLLIYLLVLGVIVWLILYAIGELAPPEPFGRMARVVVIVIACLIVILMLLSLVPFGSGPPLFRG